MTALKPLENRRVRAVPSERYPLNKKCAHPECGEDAVDPHHAFPRSAIGGDSWFVELLEDVNPDTLEPILSTPFPHVTGLCRAHHDDVEEHRAWVKLEDGVWNWYNRHSRPPRHDDEITPAAWTLAGPLNPQPGSVEGKAKRRRFQGEAKKKRKTISIRVPDGADEDGAGLLDEAVGILEEKISGDNPRPVYFTIMDALAFTNLNAGPDDFGG